VQDGAGFIHRQSDAIYEEMSKLQAISQEVAERSREVQQAGRRIASFLENAKNIQ
jgi:hypothetical protein